MRLSIPKTYPYNTRAIDIPPVAYNPSGPLRTPDGILDHFELAALENGVFDSIFPAPKYRRIFYVKNSGIPYSSPWGAYMIRGGYSAGMVFAAGVDGWGALAAAHEMGHNLFLSEVNEDGLGHDLPPYPPGVDGDNPDGQSPQHPGSPHHLKPAYALMASGEPFSVSFADSVLPWLHGWWMRHEDWKEANDNAQ